MNPLQRSPLNSSVFAAALTAAALVVSLLLRPYIQPQMYFFFLVAVWLSAWFYGRTAGLVATTASAFEIMYFFPPVDANLAIFVATSSLLAWATASWRESRQLFTSTLSSIADAVVATDRQGHITFLNPVAETLTGWTHNAARGKPVEDVLTLIDAGTREALDNPLVRALRDRATVAGATPTLLISRSGTEVPLEHSASPVRDDADRIRGAILVFRDISKRRQMEEQATQAQRMDAVGRLAGGVAGDFNNVLTVVTGYAELLRNEVAPGNPMRRFVDEIIYAGERAAAITRHLLAFSRGTQAQPRMLDLNTVVAGMEPMLRRLLGDSIELILLTTSGLGRVWADAAQIEQVIVNLATNSREAMAGGGKLVIETANVDLEDGPPGKHLGVKPGSYVMLAVSDTGVGMDPETRARLFEPFFTTKTPGKGSGLGLATVYGAIKQSEGQVTVYSQPGCGTIFEIYLPRLKAAIPEPVRKQLAKGSETILLVDDEEGVRKLVSSVLQSNGYDVLEAANGAAALAVYEKNGHKIDMVLTDVVMPQMTGVELGRTLGDRTPGLKILYMSGYRDNALGGEGSTPRAFLHKPFSPDTLLEKVREVLDAQNA